MSLIVASYPVDTATRSFNEGLSADTLKDISSGGLEQALSVSTESKTHDNMGIS
tara:strand:- start:376 stop:537 length:162 start_codon:yes stop_codon:yes gene_type:complete